MSSTAANREREREGRLNFSAISRRLPSKNKGQHTLKRNGGDFVDDSLTQYETISTTAAPHLFPFFFATLVPDIFMGRSYLFDFISYTFRSFEPTDLFQRAFLIFYVDNFQCFFLK